MSGKFPAMRRDLEDLSDVLKHVCECGCLPERKLRLEDLNQNEIWADCTKKLPDLLCYTK